MGARVGILEEPEVLAPNILPVRRPGTGVARGAKVVTVCHPVWRLARGGLERQLLQTVKFLSRGAFRHVLVVREWDEAGLPDCRAVGGNVTVVRPGRGGRDRLWALRLASVLREHSVDVLHVRGLRLLPDSWVAARLCGRVRLAFSFHGFEDAGRRIGRVRRCVYRAAVQRCDDRWAVSGTAADAIAQELGIPREGLGIIRNGVDTEHYAPARERDEIRRRLGLGVGRAVVLSVGNLKPVKGHDVLLEAIRDMNGAAANVTFVLLGGDYLDGALQDWARAHASEADVRFVGEQDDPLPWYQAADVFVLPSRREGMSNALLEAMSCGLPVVATAVGGNREVVEHGRTGLLVRPGCAEDLCRAIQRLLEDADCRAALAAAARAEVAARFGARAAAAQYADRYARLAGSEWGLNDKTEEPRE